MSYVICFNNFSAFGNRISTDIRVSVSQARLSAEGTLSPVGSVVWVVESLDFTPGEGSADGNGMFEFVEQAKGLIGKLVAKLRLKPPFGDSTLAYTLIEILTKELVWCLDDEYTSCEAANFVFALQKLNKRQIDVWQAPSE
jgi:hypothetical protein